MTDAIKKLSEQVEQLIEKDGRPLTTPEAAAYLGVSQTYFYKLTHKKKIAYYRPAGKMMYFKKSDLDKYLFRNRSSSMEEIDQKATDYVTINHEV